MSINKEKLKIFIDLKPIDWLSLNQIYLPILGKDAFALYQTIYHQKKINEHLNIEEYYFSCFLENNSIKSEKFKSLFSKLEELNLVKISIKSNVIESPTYIIQIIAPESISNALKNKKILKKLQEQIHENKFSEISLLTENNDCGYDLELNSIKKNEKESDSIIDKNLYCDFYTEIFRKLGQEFSVNDEVKELIKIYHIEDKKMSLSKMQEIALKAIKQIDKKYYICKDSFEFLINLEINEDKKSASNNELENFWRNLIDSSEKENKKQYLKLFNTLETNDFYKKLTQKNKSPAGFEKWVKDSIKNKNFTYQLLNAMVSFVKVWTKKIPINYLIKLSETIYDEDLTTPELFMHHIKGIIEHDLKQKNRLNLSYEKNENTFDIASKFLN